MPALMYRFSFADGETAQLAVQPEGPDSVAASDPELPPWTLLDFEKCGNCPLISSASAVCPMAVRLVPLIRIFAHRNSYDPVSVEVEFNERWVHKDTTVQRAMGSPMGLLAAQSGCPRTAFLRPMARYHLPFASEEETLYRVVSMYLLAQYLKQQQGGEPDWGLVNLRNHYAALQRVNAKMAQRLRASSQQDGAINAVTLLDLLAKALPYSIDEALADLAPAFAAYREL